jgi:hypothetical protein
MKEKHKLNYVFFFDNFDDTISIHVTGIKNNKKYSNIQGIIKKNNIHILLNNNDFKNTYSIYYVNPVLFKNLNLSINNKEIIPINLPN